MNKSIGIIVVVVILVLGGVYFSRDKGGVSIIKDIDNEAESTAESEDKPMVAEEGSKMDQGEMVTGPGSYEIYAPEKLMLAENGDVVLFFRASWCPTCRALDADIKANANNIPEGVHILDVDYDNSTALKQKYGVTYQHTLVQVDKDGNQIAKWMGSPTLASLILNIK